MKKLIIAALLLIGASATNAEILDIRPDAAPKTAAPVAVDWQKTNKSMLAAATTDAELAKVVASAKAASELLANVRGAYLTDALLMHKIAAVTQWVMEPGAYTKRANQRKLWVNALMNSIKNANDEYVKTFCLDQLRWCASPSDASTILSLCSKSSKAVKDFSVMVSKELKAARK